MLQRSATFPGNPVVYRALLLLLLNAVTFRAARADEAPPAVAPKPVEPFGHLSGRIVFNGPAPVLPALVPAVNAGCGFGGAVPDESLVVDAKGGLANVFVYLKRKPAVIHPSIARVPTVPVDVTILGARYFPHAAFVRVGQDVIVKNLDPCQHNSQPVPILNQPRGILLPPNQPEKHSFPKAEFLPIPVRCNLHPWMEAHWLILDHPYATITDSDGTFTLRHLPASSHEVRIWHEESGWLEKSLVVNIVAGKTTQLGNRAYAPLKFR